MTGARSSELDAVASAIQAVGANGEPKRRILLLAYGDPFFGRDGGGPYRLLDRAHAETVVAASRQLLGSADMLVDYDHQSVYSATQGVGGQAKAAGWIKGLSVDGQGIWGDVDWTEAAESVLAAREYRYISPFFKVDRDTRKVTRIVNAGLTNSPALELPAVASADHKEKPVTLIASAAILAALGLASDASEQNVLASIDQLKTGKDTAEAGLRAVAQKLELKDGASASDIAVAASAAHQRAEAGVDATKFVPKAQYDELVEERRKQREADVVAAVDQGVKDGKVQPSLRDWLISQAGDDVSVVAAFTDKAAAFDGDKPLADKKPDAEAKSLSDEEKAVCSVMGWDETAFLEQKKKEAV